MPLRCAWRAAASGRASSSTAALLKSLDSEYRKLRRRRPRALAPPSCRSFEERSSFARSRHVHVDEDGGYEGVTEGLDDRGFLLVRTDSGLAHRAFGRCSCAGWKIDHALGSRCRQHQHRAGCFPSQPAERGAHYGPLIAHWRVSTTKTQTVDEYGVLFRNLFAMNGIEVRLGAGHGHLFGGAAARLHAARSVRALLSLAPAVHRARREDRHAGALRQSGGSGRRPHRQQRGRVREVRRPVHHRGLRNRHHLRRGLEQGRIPGRRDHAGHRHLGRRAVRAHRSPAPRRYPQAAARAGDQHRQQRAVRPLLRISWADRWHSGAAASPNWATT